MHVECLTAQGWVRLRAVELPATSGTQCMRTTAGCSSGWATAQQAKQQAKPVGLLQATVRHAWYCRRERPLDQWVAALGWQQPNFGCPVCDGGSLRVRGEGGGGGKRGVQGAGWGAACVVGRWRPCVGDSDGLCWLNAGRPSDVVFWPIASVGRKGQRGTRDFTFTVLVVRGRRQQPFWRVACGSEVG